MLCDEAVEDVVDIGRVGNGAVEIAGQPQDAVLDSDMADLDQALVVPDCIVAAKLDL